MIAIGHDTEDAWIRYDVMEPMLSVKTLTPVKLVCCLVLLYDCSLRYLFESPNG